MLILVGVNFAQLFPFILTLYIKVVVIGMVMVFKGQYPNRSSYLYGICVTASSQISYSLTLRVSVMAV